VKFSSFSAKGPSVRCIEEKEENREESRNKDKIKKQVMRENTRSSLQNSFLLVLFFCWVCQTVGLFSTDSIFTHQKGQNQPNQLVICRTERLDQPKKPTE
jgi:hypothetical protein